MNHAQQMDGTNGTSSTQFTLRCTYPGCRCSAFRTDPLNVRQCTSCAHGFVPHAFDRLGIVYEWDMKKVEPVDYSVVFDIASLILYGTTAIPFRLHACLYRLVIQLQNPHQEMTRITSQFDWTWDDFCTGFKTRDSNGDMRNTWNYADLTDETMILMHFLKYQTTQAVAEKFIQELRQQKKDENPYLDYYSKPSDSGLQMFFSQNQLKSSLPVGSNGLMHGPSANGFSQMSVTQNVGPGKPLILSANQTQQRSLNGMNGPDSNALSLNGALTTSLLLRPMHNGSFQLQALHPSDMNQSNHHQTQPQQNGVGKSNVTHVMSTGHTSGIQSERQVATPGKRTLKPKPATVTPVAAPAPVVKVEPVPPTPQVTRPLSPCLSPTPPLKKVKTESNSPSESGAGVGAVSPKEKQQKGPARRVYCENCQKSFCDKGALKIHYSAVHLKEMHRCTIRGCNMMFSSRRSRNRHSSNPNQRLHSNLFAPRRGGILVNDVELPPQNDSLDNNDLDDLSDGDGDRSMSYDEVATMLDDTPTDLSKHTGRLTSPVVAGEENDGKLVISDEDNNDLLDEMEVDGHGPISVVTNSAMDKPTASGATGITGSLLPLGQASPNSSKTHFVSQNLDGRHGCRLQNGSECSDRVHDELYDDSDDEQTEAALESLGAVLPTAKRDEFGKIIVPVNVENPSCCVTCGKIFKNQFTVRTHYINVHLRVMHTCTVPGCRSQFPSVRSRDRHSANVNLHEVKSMNGNAPSPEVAFPSPTVTPAFIG